MFNPYAGLEYLAKRRQRSYSTVQKSRKLKPRKVSRYINKASPELKNFDYVNTGADIVSDIPVVACINAITTGTSSVQMLGRRCMMKAIQLNYNLTYDYNASIIGTNIINNPVVARIMLVYDNQPSGSLPTMTDVLNSAAGVNDFLNLNNTDRFTVLFDKRHSMGCVNVVTGSVTYSHTTGPLNADNQWYKKTNLLFEGPSTAGIVGINHGAIYFMCTSDRTTASSALVVRCATRIRFSDN